MAESSNTRKRRFFFIDKEFQSRFSMGWLALSYMLAAVVCVLSVAGTVLYERYLTGVQEASQNMRGFIIAFYVVSVIIVFWLIIAIVVMAVRQSHRIAGSVYRMRHDVRKALDGDFNVQIDLRKGDFFPELSQEINGLLRRLKVLSKERESCANAALELSESVFRCDNANDELKELAKRVEDKVYAQRMDSQEQARS